MKIGCLKQDSLFLFKMVKLRVIRTIVAFLLLQYAHNLLE
jgi:hypothetical protein